MLIVEDWASAAHLLEGGDNLVEEMFAWILMLLLFVVRVVAVIGNGENTIDGEGLSPRVSASAMVGTCGMAYSLATAGAMSSAGF